MWSCACTLLPATAACGLVTHALLALQASVNSWTRLMQTGPPLPSSPAQPAGQRRLQWPPALPWGMRALQSGLSSIAISSQGGRSETAMRLKGLAAPRCTRACTSVRHRLVWHSHQLAAAVPGCLLYMWGAGRCERHKSPSRCLNGSFYPWHLRAQGRYRPPLSIGCTPLYGLLQLP